MVIRSRMDIAEFERIAPRLGPCELVRGRVVYLSPGGLPHSTVSGNIAGLISAWARKTRRGRVLTNEAGLVTDEEPGTVRGADVAFISYKRLPRGPVPDGFGRTPPELVVEIVGKGQGWDTMVEKAGEYLTMGVDRVWIVDVNKQHVHVFRRDEEPMILNARMTITDPDVLPGFRSRVRAFFD
jgi:Uma2 family endonuclease